MSNDSIKGIFDLRDEDIVNWPHVRVKRLSPQGRQLARYCKEFKFDADKQHDYSIWTDYEIRLLSTLIAKSVKPVVQMAMLSRPADAGSTPLVTQLETHDAGLDINKWCRIQPRYTDGSTANHPFQHTEQYLQLMRACLVALKEIHKHDIVHCDIKGDNICLIYAPYPYDPASDKPVKMAFDKLKLIDFAWSVAPDVALTQPLPISGNTKASYQSPWLKAALIADNQSGTPNEVKKLDYRVDLYSLGDMAELIVGKGLTNGAGYVGGKAFDGARRLGPRLKALSMEKKPAIMPHDGLIAEIDGWLKDLPTSNASQREQFFVSSVSPVGKFLATPVTPLVTTTRTDKADDRPIPKPTFEWTKTVVSRSVLAVMLLVGLGAVVNNFDLWQVLVSANGGTPAKPPVPILDPVASAADRLASRLVGDSEDDFLAASKELAGLIADGKPAAKQMMTKLVADYGGRLTDVAQPLVQRQRAFGRLTRLAAVDSQEALGKLKGFRDGYATKSRKFAYLHWWTTKSDAPPPAGLANWLADGAVLAVNGDISAVQYQAYAYANGLGVKQDRAKALAHWLEAARLASEKNDADPEASKKVSADAQTAERELLDEIIKFKDVAAAQRLQALMESQAATDNGIFQYYLGRFNQDVFEPANLEQAANWYCKAIVTPNHQFQESARTQLKGLNRICPSANRTQGITK